MSVSFVLFGVPFLAPNLCQVVGYLCTLRESLGSDADAGELETHISPRNGNYAFFEILKRWSPRKFGGKKGTFYFKKDIESRLKFSVERAAVLRHSPVSG